MENTVTFYIAFLILFQLVVPVTLQICARIDGTLACCTGYKLNHERNDCIPCDRGFRGENCDTKCPYPTYGEDCQSKCNCNVTYCDHVSGCTETSEGSFSATVENTTNFYYSKKTQSKGSTALMLAVIGLTGVFLIVIMMYIFTGLLEKCLVNTNKF